MRSVRDLPSFSPFWPVPAEGNIHRGLVFSRRWDRPEFIRTNHVITPVWALAFAVMLIVEFALLYVPSLSSRLGIIAIILASSAR
jgi:hypothetical protein